jgi:hypothetical protein
MGFGSIGEKYKPPPPLGYIFYHLSVNGFCIGMEIPYDNDMWHTSQHKTIILRSLVYPEDGCFNSRSLKVGSMILKPMYDTVIISGWV